MSELHERVIEAGRELDALVAEKVMGWRWYNTLKINALFRVDPQYPWEAGLAEEPRGREHLDGCWHYDSSRGGEQIPKFPEYSTDIAAAWEIVESFISAGCAGSVEGDGHTGYRALVTSGKGRFEASGDTAPHAICLAALKAKEV